MSRRLMLIIEWEEGDAGMRLYTGAGDEGETGLLRGRRISKGTDHIDAIGEIDELNAMVGLTRAHPHVSTDEKLDDTLRKVQNLLFSIGAELAADEQDPAQITMNEIREIEGIIDEFTDGLPPIRHFILPSGDEGACRLHLTRAIARRAERALVRLSNERSISSTTLIYLNRLSDFLFVAARRINFSANCPEEAWKSR